jgi:hypothetical protein
MSSDQAEHCRTAYPAIIPVVCRTSATPAKAAGDGEVSVSRSILSLEILEHGTYIVSCGHEFTYYFNGEEKTPEAVVERMKREGGIWLGKSYYQWHRFTRIEVSEL